MVMTVMLALLGLAFNYIPSLSELTDYYIQGSLTGYAVAPMYESVIQVQDYARPLVMEAASHYAVEAQAEDDAVLLYSKNRDELIKATNAGAKAAGKGFVSMAYLK